MSRRRGGWIAILLIVTATSATRGGDPRTPPESGFWALSLDEVLKVAAEVERTVLVAFQTDWDPASLELDRAVWTSPRLKLLLRTRFVALRMNADAEVRMSDRCAVETIPTIVLLRPDGTPFDRVTGFRSSVELIAELEDALAGKDALRRACDAVERTRGRSPPARERLAEALAAAGARHAALEEYLWCFDEGLRQNVMYGTTRRDALASAIARFGQVHPAALEALRVRRDAREAALLGGDPQAETAHELAALNAALDTRRRLIAVRDGLAPQSPARMILYPFVFDLLIEDRRYAEILAETDPLTHFAETARAARAQRRPCCMVHYRGGRFTGETVVERGAKLVEALAGAGRSEEARRLIDAVLAYEDTPEHRTLLLQHLQRCGADGLAAELTARPAATKRP